MNSLSSRRIFALLIMAISVMAPVTAAADNYNRDPHLFTLTVPGLSREPKEFDIPIKYGEGKSQPIAQSDTWRIYGGSKFDERPSSHHPILVELHGKVGPVRKLVARVMVQYFENADGRWQPLFLLSQEPLMVPTPQGWKPLFDTRESPEILGILNRDLPNAQGYRPYVDFKVQRGKIIIDSWNVKTTY